MAGSTGQRGRNAGDGRYTERSPVVRYVGYRDVFGTCSRRNRDGDVDVTALFDLRDVRNGNGKTGPLIPVIHVKAVTRDAVIRSGRGGDGDLSGNVTMKTEYDSSGGHIGEIEAQQGAGGHE